MQADLTRALQERVQQAFSDRTPLQIVGGNTKEFLGFPLSGEPLDLAGHQGILDYAPAELVLRARAGTPLAEINDTLKAHGQCLASEPPAFGGAATFGGVVAAGLSGPGRPYRAAVQDTVLGCTILNGKGECLRFGGKVMKNVAGYDVSRLMVGSLGCLGVILDITVKVIPVAETELTVDFSVEDKQFVLLINKLRRLGLPLTATCQTSAHTLRVRFSAGYHEISSLPARLEQALDHVKWQIPDADDFWAQLKEQQLDFFNLSGDDILWRLSLPGNTEIQAVCPDETRVIREWGGAQVWLKSHLDHQVIFDFAAKAGGHASIFRHPEPSSCDHVFQPLSGTLMTWQQQLKHAFDPAGILNAGRMYRGV